MSSALGAAAVVVGPWSLAGRARAAASGLAFLTRSEYDYINRMAAEIIPDEPILSGKVDVAKNLDRFFAERNRSRDFLIMLRFLRLIRMADAALPLLRRVSAATAEDILSFKRTICFLGYYSDANGESDLPPEQRIVWPRLGYGGPKPDDWFPPDSETALDPAALVDRIGGGA